MLNAKIEVNSDNAPLVKMLFGHEVHANPENPLASFNCNRSLTFIVVLVDVCRITEVQCRRFKR